MLFLTLPRQNSQISKTNYRHIEMKTIVRNGKTFIQKIMDFPNVKIVIKVEEVDNSENFIASIAIIPTNVISKNETPNIYHFKYIVDRKEMMEIMQMISTEQIMNYMKSKSHARTHRNTQKRKESKRKRQRTSTTKHRHKTKK